MRSEMIRPVLLILISGDESNYGDQKSMIRPVSASTSTSTDENKTRGHGGTAGKN